MDYKLNLQTGFYKKTAYNIKIEKHKMTLIPLNNSDIESIQILDKDITAILVDDLKNPGIEIQTYSRNFIGTLDKDTNMMDLIILMKEYLNVDFIFIGGGE
ncbi:MAG: hypothetical protein RBR71_06885 [Gudongella sp.]|nr:hypothetical protein [Gudongella sp.]